MKVCHITSAHKRCDLRIHVKECASLAKNGYETHCIVCDDKGDCIGEDGVYVHSTGYNAKNRFSRLFISNRKAYELAKSLNADVYHLHDPELLMYARKLQRNGKKVIFDSHEDVVGTIEEKIWIPFFLRKIIKVAYQTFQHSICKRLDAIITVTPSLVEFFMKINKNTYLVTNYPIIEEVEICRERKNQVCFAGGIEEQWCHEEIIKSINQIQNIKYLYAGRITNEYKEKLSKLGKGKSEYLGLLNREEVYKLLSESVAGLAINNARQMSKADGSLGNTKLFEYMMCGTPVICSNYSHWREIIEDNKCGKCVDNENADELKAAIEFFLSNPDAVVEFGKNGQKLVKEKYNWSVSEKELLRLYNTLK